MTELANTVGREFAAFFENIGAKAHKWIDPLSDEQFWRNPYNYGNSVGHLLLHLTGQSELLHRRANWRHRLRPQSRSRVH
jgi:hypothetical protein